MNNYLPCSSPAQRGIRSYKPVVTLLLMMILGLLVLLPATASVGAQTDPNAPPPYGVVPTLQEADTEAVKALPNLSSGLSRLVLQWEAGRPLDEILTGAPQLKSSGERVMVMLVMSDAHAAQEIVAILPDLGAEEIVSFDKWVDAWVPLGALETVAALPGISMITEPIEVLPVASLYESTQPLDNAPFPELLLDSQSILARTQGVNVSGAHVWQAANWTGRGVKVAVLDSFQDYRQAQALGELPSNISIYSPAWSPISYGNRHGTACAEIIHDMAPGAHLTFASPRDAVSMARLIWELAAQGNKIISSSVGWYGLEPGDGTGPLNNAIRYAYEQYGTLFVQAAGNQRRNHWDGRFRDSNGDHWHEFAGN